MFIYLIVNHVTGKYYVGKTKESNLRRYWSQQKFRIFNPKSSQTSKPYLYNAVRKYGWDKFTIHALRSDFISEEECLACEKDFIAFLKSQDPEYGYNICAGGRGAIGWKPSSETRARISASNKGKHRERLLLPEMQAKRIANWQQSLEEHEGSFHNDDTSGKIKQARAQQDEFYRLEKFNEYEREHGIERRTRAAATHRNKKHEMTAEGSRAISDAFKRGNRKRWSAHSLTGQTFGRLTVESQAGRSERGLILWDCLCTCGNHTVGRTDMLRNGHKQSCGCLANEARRKNGAKARNFRILKQGHYVAL